MSRSNLDLSKTYDPAAIEGHWYQAWEASGSFRAGDNPEVKEAFCILLPPPNVTGTLHMGHGFNQTLMDALTRYQRMRGVNTLWQPGTDHAGIATQLVVERLLEKEGLKRHDLGRDAFIERVWQWKQFSGGHITEQMRRLGTSPDWTRERFTMDPGLSRTVVESFVRLYRQGLIYRGKRMVHWDPVLRSAVSDLEVQMEERDGHLWEICYPFVDGPIDGQRGLTVATTRPETLLGDVAVAVHGDDPRYQRLIGKHVRLPLCDRTIPIIADAFVDPAFGSGAVKVTPAHDMNDHQCGKRHGLPIITVLTPEATVSDEAPARYRGLDRFDARTTILADLEGAGFLLAAKPHRHALPLGDRSGVVLEPMLTDQWFVAVCQETDRPSMRDQARAAVDDGRIRFYPETWANTYHQWLDNLQDWCISRQLWWGHQIPAWYSDDGRVYVAHDADEAAALAKADGYEGVLRRDADVLDTWYSSALWPFSTLDWTPDYPNVSNPMLDRYLPSSVLVTGFDIIFFWVARMVMMTMHLTGKIPFRDVYVHGLIRDSQGQKMSKSKGNVLDPIDLIDGIGLPELIAKRTQGLMLSKQAAAIEKATRSEFPQGIAAFGVDALRFTYASLASPGRDIKFDLQRCEGYRHFCNKLWNACRFVRMHCGEGDFTRVAERRSLADRWIVSRLQRVEQQVAEHFAQYRFDLLAQSLYQFVWDDYCDWYLEATKLSLTSADAELAYAARRTALLVLEATLRLLHPLIPFITEELWQALAPLAGKRSVTFVMNAAYPVADPSKLDGEAEQAFAQVKELIECARNLRGEMKLSPAERLPLVLECPDPSASSALLFSRESALIALLSKASTVAMTAMGSEPPMFAAQIAGLRLSFVVDIDPKRERERLLKEIAKATRQADVSRSKLQSESFRAKAPAAVVIQEENRLAESLRLLDEWQGQLARLPTE